MVRGLLTGLLLSWVVTLPGESPCQVEPERCKGLSCNSFEGQYCPSGCYCMTLDSMTGRGRCY